MQSSITTLNNQRVEHIFFVRASRRTHGEMNLFSWATMALLKGSETIMFN